MSILQRKLFQGFYNHTLTAWSTLSAKVIFLGLGLEFGLGLEAEFGFFLFSWLSPRTVVSISSTLWTLNLGPLILSSNPIFTLENFVKTVLFNVMACLSADRP